MIQIKDPKFLAEVQSYQNGRDKELLENEVNLSSQEKEEKVSSKKKEMEAFLK